MLITYFCTPQYNWNIVESGIKHHNPYPCFCKLSLCIRNITVITFSKPDEWVLLFNANSASFQLYHCENKLLFNEMMMRSALLQYFSYIVAVSFIRGGNWRKSLTCRESLTNLSHNVVHLALIEIRPHNISGDRLWVHR